MKDRSEYILDILAIFLPLSEIFKQILLTGANGGTYVWWYFPFQLCSMPLYLLPLRQILVHTGPQRETIMAGGAAITERLSANTPRKKSLSAGTMPTESSSDDTSPMESPSDDTSPTESPSDGTTLTECMSADTVPTNPDLYPESDTKPSFRTTCIRVLTDFLADFCLLGGIFVFLDQSGMHYALFILTIHSYLWHILMIFLGCFLILTRRHSCPFSTAKNLPASFQTGFVRSAPDQNTSAGLSVHGAHSSLQKAVDFLKDSFRRYLPCAKLLLVLAGIAEILNALFHTRGSINMFYISFWEPVTQAVLKDIAAVTGTLPEIILYVFLLLLGGFLFHLLGDLYLFLRPARKK